MSDTVQIFQVTPTLWYLLWIVVAGKWCWHNSQLPIIKYFQLGTDLKIVTARANVKHPVSRLPTPQRSVSAVRTLTGHSIQTKSMARTMIFSASRVRSFFSECPIMGEKEKEKILTFL
ncbi:hypothetical protein TNCV_3824941 [Trichonephila clavipes]|nr:hypothetical protein TNCV_3824941 [Trichonephila clavipes]